jgi:hypothetical protein
MVGPIECSLDTPAGTVWCNFQIFLNRWSVAVNPVCYPIQPTKLDIPQPRPLLLPHLGPIELHVT